MALTPVKQQYLVYNGAATNPITLQYAMGNASAGTGRYLVFFHGGDVATATYNGISLSAAATNPSPFCRLWVAEDAFLPTDTSDHDLVLTFGGNRTNQGVLVAEFSGAEQLGVIPPAACASGAAGTTHPVTFDTTIDSVPVLLFCLRVEDRTMDAEPAGTPLLSIDNGVVFDGQRIILGAGPATAGSATFTFDSSGTSNGRVGALQLEEAATSGTAHDGAAALDGDGSFAASGVLEKAATAAVSGTGALALTATRSRAGAAVVSGTGTFTSAGVIAGTGAAALSGTGTFAGAATVTRGGAAALSGAGLFAAAASMVRQGSLVLSGAGALLIAGALPSRFRHITGKVRIRPVVTGRVRSYPVVSGKVTMRPVVRGKVRTARFGYPLAGDVWSGALAVSGAGAFAADGAVVEGTAGLVWSGTGLLTLVPHRVRVAAFAASGTGSFAADGEVTASITPLLHTFSGGDNATTVGVSDSGHTATVFNGGTWGRSGGQCYRPVAAVNSFLAWDVGASDGDFEVTLSLVTTETARVAWRATDGTHLFFLNSTGNVIKREGGTTVLGNIGASVTGDVIRVHLAGTSIEIFRNEVSVFSTTHAFNQTATLQGIGVFDSAGILSRFDDVSFTPP